MTISTNLFGTTYYSLVGLHAFHVTAGLIFLRHRMIFTFLGKVKPEHKRAAEIFSLYGISLMRSGHRFSPWFMSSVAKESRFAWYHSLQQWKHPGPHQARSIYRQPTAWPIILAFGITPSFAGLLTSASVSILDDPRR